MVGNCFLTRFEPSSTHSHTTGATNSRPQASGDIIYFSRHFYQMALNPHIVTALLCGPNVLQGKVLSEEEKITFCVGTGECDGL